MERRETVSVKLSDINECIKKKIYEQYPYLAKDNDDIYSLELASNVKFLLYKVVRMCDVVKDSEVEQG